jgi:hypothetical protein
MNFHIFSAYNSEISSECQEIIRNCPNTLNELEKKLELSEYSVLIAEKNSELSEYCE